MNAPNAPGGLKPTEERLSEHTLWRMEHDANTFYCSDNIRRLLSAYKSLAAERDAKDAEIARLRKAMIEAGIAAGALLAEEVSSDFLMYVPEEVRLVVARLRNSATRAEARLAAMAIVTEVLAEALRAHESWESDIILSADWGPGGMAPLPTLTQEQMDALSDVQNKRNAALDAFVSDKTAGGA